MRKLPDIPDDDDAFLNALVAKSRRLVGTLPTLGLANPTVEFSISAPGELNQYRNDNTGTPANPKSSLDSQSAWLSPRQRPTMRRRHLPMSLVKSKQRVADHGEVFTPAWLVEAMLDLVKGETERIDSRFLEPACGSGNFLVRILERKLAAVELKFGKSNFEKRHYALLALMCTYGIEVLADNIAECRANMLGVLADYLTLDEADDLYRAASYVLSQNLIHGDALRMRTSDGQPITFAEWGYLGKGKFQRRDFRLDVLTQMSGFGEEGKLFAQLDKHAVFTPVKSYPPKSMGKLAAALDDVVKEAV